MLGRIGMSPRLLRVGARTLLFALTITTLGPVLHGVHDDQYDPTPVAHDASRHQVEAGPPLDSSTSADSHCVACHFARASRGPAAWSQSGLTTLTIGVLLYHADGQLGAAPAVARRPARAPPLV
jgi:hypothetical protein